MIKPSNIFTPALLLWLLLPFSAHAQKISLADISRYFNALTSFTADFEQVNNSGQVTSGKLYMIRPARVRFEYQGDDAPLVIISGGQVAIFDTKSNESPIRFPLRFTPLAPVLRANVALEASDMIRDHFVQDGQTILSLQDPQNTEYGYIRLMFSDNPIKLDGWLTVDGSGNTTSLRLKNLQNEVSIDWGLFNITRAMEEWEKRRVQ